MTDWERAYKIRDAEHGSLRRAGIKRRHRLLRLWHATDEWPCWAAAWTEPVIARVACLVHNHTPMTEMDGRTIVCALCGRVLGTHAPADA